MAKKVRIPDPLSEISGQLVEVLEQHSARMEQNSEIPFLSWSQLVATQSGVPTDWVSASLLRPPSRGRVVVAISDDLKSPVALNRQIDQLVRDPVLLQRLTQHPSYGCSESFPVRTLSELCRPLDKLLRSAVEEYWTSAADHLPLGLEFVQRRSGSKGIGGIHDRRFQRPELQLSVKLTTALETLRKAGDQHYPAQWSELLSKAGIASDEPLLTEAAMLPPFADTAFLAAGRLPDGWLCLRTDAEEAVLTEGFLRRLLIHFCSQSEPEIRLAVLSRNLNRELQNAFTETWNTHFDLQRTFPFMEMVNTGSRRARDLIIRDARYPRPERIVSEHLVKALEKLRGSGGEEYPPPWNRLTERIRPEADSELLQRAIQVEPFSGRVIIAFPAIPDAPAAFIEDAAKLAMSEHVMRICLTLVTSPENQAVTTDKLLAVRGMHPLLRPHFAAVIEQLTDSDRTPPGIGRLKIHGRVHWFSTIANGPVGRKSGNRPGNTGMPSR